jgi:hypothetical protein
LPVATAVLAFQSAVAQCDSLIANAHKTDGTGVSVLPELDRRQITVAAFLNMFIAWETFLEATASALLSGAPTTNGTHPAKLASPASIDDARRMFIGVNRYFDYGNHQHFCKMIEIYFVQGRPFQPHLNAIQSALDDLRTMRNACAHVTSTTQSGLESLAIRLLARPSPGIAVYDLLTATDPKTTGTGTIFQTNRDLLLATAALISIG